MTREEIQKRMDELAGLYAEIHDAPDCLAPLEVATYADYRWLATIGRTVDNVWFERRID